MTTTHSSIGRPDCETRFNLANPLKRGLNMFGTSRMLLTHLGFQNICCPTEPPLAHEFRGRRTFSCLIPLLLAAHSAWAMNPHPRIWLDSQMLADLAVKARGGDADWTAMLADSASGLNNLPPVVKITAASNASSVQFTSSATLPFSSGALLIIAGATGTWTGVNTGDTSVTATVTGTYTFTIPVNSSGFGSFSGQVLTVFVFNGCTGAFMCYDSAASYQGSGWYYYAVQAALIYKVTGNTTYRDFALTWLDYMNSLGVAGIIRPVTTDSGYGSRFVPLTLGIIYDWCFADLSSAQKTATVTTAHTWFAWTSAYAFGTIPGTGEAPNSNYTGGHVLGYGVLGYAIADEDSGTAILDWVAGLWTSSIASGFSAPVVGKQFGDSPMGTGVFYSGVSTEQNYIPTHIYRLLQYLLAIRTATGAALPTPMVDAAKLWATAELYDLKPDRWRTRMDGNWSGNVGGVFRGNLPMAVACVLGGTTEGQWMQWMFTHFGTPSESTYSPLILNAKDGGYLDRVLFYRPSATATDYRLSQPPFRFAAGSDFRMYWQQ